MLFHIASGIILIIFSIILIRKKRSLQKIHKSAQFLLKGSKPAKTKIVEGAVLFTNYPFIVLWFLTTIGFFDHILFEKHTLYSVAGILLMMIGVTVYGVSVFQLGNKWRVGIDYEDNDYFVTNGLYAYSRHPAYLGFYLLFTGIMLHYASVIMIVFGSISIAALFFMAAEEETYLIYKFRQTYRHYQSKVRFLFGKKR